MNKVLQLLQRLGENAALRHLHDTQLEQVINPLNLDPAIQQAICQQDDITLARLLHANNKIVCMIIPAEEPEDKPAEQPAKHPENVPEPTESELKQVG